jgi:hypothetical protein
MLHYSYDEYHRIYENAYTEKVPLDAEDYRIVEDIRAVDN